MLSKLSFLTNFVADSPIYDRLYRLLAAKSKKFVNSSKAKGLAEKFNGSFCDVLILDSGTLDEELLGELKHIRAKFLFAPFIAVASSDEEEIKQENIPKLLNLGAVYLLKNDFDSNELKETLLSALKPLSSVNNIKKKLVQASDDKNECQNMFDMVPSMIINVKNGEVTEANKRFLDFFGCESIGDFRSLYDYFGKIFIPLKGYVSVDGEDDWISAVLRRPEGHRKCVLKSAEGGIYKFVLHFVEFKNKEGYIVSFTDITQEEDILLNKIRDYELASSPRASSWKNVRENLSVEVHRSERYGTIFSLILFCLSDSKNSTRMLDRMGDGTFGIIEKIALNTIRPTDLFAKWENNRYFIIAYKTNREGAVKFAERLMAEMRKNNIIRQNQYCFKISTVTYQKNDSQNLMIKRAMNGLAKALKDDKDSIVSDSEAKKDIFSDMF